MKTIRITVEEPNYPITFISVHNQTISSFNGIPEPIGVHAAINYRANCDGDLLPFLVERPTYFTPARLRCHLPYFRNCQQLF
ncbi:hypothetical protein [Spirosoma litoris]